MNFCVGSFFRVAGALTVGAVLIGGAFFAHNKQTVDASIERTAIKASVGQNVRMALNEVDTDGDGFPDWEEELRGTDPYTFDEPVTVPTTTTAATDIEDEPYQRPTTVTDSFAETFLEKIVRESAGRDLTPEAQSKLIGESISALESQVRDPLFTRTDIQVTSATDLAAAREYGNGVGTIITRHSLQNENELVIVERAFTQNDPAQLSALAPIEGAYRNMIRDLRALPVPSDLADEHLDLLNTMNMIASGLAAMQHSFDDPLAAFVRIQRYPDDAAGLFYAFENIRTALESRGVVYTTGEPGMLIFSFRP